MKVLLNNQTYINFTDYGIDLYYNTIASTFAFSSLSDIILNPFGYDEVKIFDDNDNLILTGTVTGFNKKGKHQFFTSYSYNLVNAFRCRMV